MAEVRPDPDQLLERVKAEEARERRGRLRIFFGASAGVGKTYAMLEAAHGALASGHGPGGGPPPGGGRGRAPRRRGPGAPPGGPAAPQAARRELPRHGAPRARSRR